MNIPAIRQHLFWIAATALAAALLLASVVAGRWIGTVALSHSAQTLPAATTLTVATPPEVVGGRPLAAAVPGQSSPIWTNTSNHS